MVALPRHCSTWLRGRASAEHGCVAVPVQKTSPSVSLFACLWCWGQRECQERDLNTEKFGGQWFKESGATPWTGQSQVNRIVAKPRTDIASLSLSLSVLLPPSPFASLLAHSLLCSGTLFERRTGSFQVCHAKLQSCFGPCVQAADELRLQRVCADVCKVATTRLCASHGRDRI
jgi:hypothetical protein